MSSLTSVIRFMPLFGKGSLRARASSCCLLHSCISQMSPGQGAGRQRPIARRAPLHPQITYSQTRFFAKDKGSKDRKNKSGKPKVVLRDDEMASVINVQDMKDEFAAIADGLKETFIKTLSIRSGTGIEDLEVEYDGTKYPLKELATISRKQANVLVLNLSSMPDAIKPVIEAINNSGMNVNPQQEGTLLYLSLPRVTREHREILAKNAKTLFNKAKDELAKTMSKYVKDANDAKLIRNVSGELVFNTIENIRYLELQALAECEKHLNTKVKELLGE